MKTTDLRKKLHALWNRHKTAAFALPILARIDIEDRSPQALVLAPTRELALQSADAFESFASHIGGVSILPIYGGAPYGAQLSGLRRGAQVIVGTPGRIIDHLEKGSLDISGLRFLVLDGQQHPRLDVHQVRRHRDELARHLKVKLLTLLEVGKVLL